MPSLYLREGAVELGDHVAGAAQARGFSALPICARCRSGPECTGHAGCRRGGLKARAGVVVRVLPEVLAAPIAAVEPAGPAGRELLRRADQRTRCASAASGRARTACRRMRRAGRSRTGRRWRRSRPGWSSQVAVPRRRARQRARRRVVLREAGVDRVLAVVGPGRAEARLDHLAERDLVHLVLRVAGRQHVARQRRRVLVQVPARTACRCWPAAPG